MEANGVQIQDVESDGIHYDLAQEAVRDDAAVLEVFGADTPRLKEHTAPVSEAAVQETGADELLGALQTLEAQAWDVKKRFETLQDMIEDLTDAPTFNATHRDPFVELSKTVATDLQEMYRTLRVLLKHKAPEYHTGVWKKSSRARK